MRNSAIRLPTATLLAHRPVFDSPPPPLSHSNHRSRSLEDLQDLECCFGRSFGNAARNKNASRALVAAVRRRNERQIEVPPAADAEPAQPEFWLPAAHAEWSNPEMMQGTRAE
jgi:hypothetical protein